MSHGHSTSQPPPQPTTPLRRSSSRAASTHGGSSNLPASTDGIASLEPVFAELSDGMADLEANFMHLQIMHESLARFSECFASFLYGLNVNAFCVDFPEAPVLDSFRRAKADPRFQQAQQTPRDSPVLRHAPAQRRMFDRSINPDAGLDMDQTFLTNDTSFVENPPSAVKPRSTAPRGRAATTSTRGGTGGQRGAAVQTSRTAASQGRGNTSGIARASARGVGRGGTTASNSGRARNGTGLR